MLLVNCTINGRHQASDIKIVRGQPHDRLKHHFWYSYQANDDQKHRYLGKVLHDYDNGHFALLQKVTKAIVNQQKSAEAL